MNTLTQSVTPERHKGKCALVTGGASGIGEGIARRLLSEGANVAVLDREPIPKSLEALGCVGMIGDAANEAEVNGSVTSTVETLGGLDIMVSNAGVISIKSVLDMPFEEWQRVTRINIDSVFLGAKAAAKAMIKQGRGGVIINAASGAGRRGVPNIAHYCASKAAVINLTQSLSLELATHRIRVNCYVPGHIDTPFWETIASGFSSALDISHEEVLQRFKDSIPWGRFGTVEDVAATASWLASDDAEFINGQAIAMNGAEFLY